MNKDSTLQNGDSAFIHEKNVAICNVPRRLSEGELYLRYKITTTLSLSFEWLDKCICYSAPGLVYQVILHWAYRKLGFEIVLPKWED